MGGQHACDEAALMPGWASAWQLAWPTLPGQLSFLNSSATTPAASHRAVCAAKAVLHDIMQALYTSGDNLYLIRAFGWVHSALAWAACLADLVPHDTWWAAAPSIQPEYDHWP